MDYQELAARQALKIEWMSVSLSDREKRLENILMMLVCIGGPLNDNKDGYTKEQLRVFHQISDETDIS